MGVKARESRSYSLGKESVKCHVGAGKNTLQAFNLSNDSDEICIFQKQLSWYSGYLLLSNKLPPNFAALNNNCFITPHYLIRKTGRCQPANSFVAQACHSVKISWWLIWSHVIGILV